MRVAILHDYLNQFGGAERVLGALLEIFPDAHLYTLLHDDKKTRGLFGAALEKTSFLDFAFVRNHHRVFIPLMPLAASSLRGTSPYDLVISSTAGYSKGFGVKAPYHISYCHTPLRYAWETHYLETLPFIPRFISECIGKPIARALRGWDKRSAGGVNVFLAPSTFIAEKIRSYYGRDALVVHPPVDTSLFYPEPLGQTQDYYLMVGRLLHYKDFDVGIEACDALRRPLKIVGVGPDAKRLKSLTRSHHIEFISDAGDDDLRLLYSNAHGLIFPQVEDFGLVAAEAQCCGLPIIAYGHGGGKEIVEDGETGLLFQEHSAVALTDALRTFDAMKFNRENISKRGLRFSKEQFKNTFLKCLSGVGFDHRL